MQNKNKSDGDDMTSDAVKLLGCLVDLGRGTRADTTKRISAAVEEWGAIKSRLTRVNLTCLSRAGSWMRWFCPLCSVARKFYPSRLRKNGGKRRYLVFVNKIVAAVVWSVLGMTRMQVSGIYTYDDFAKWCGIKTVDALPTPFTWAVCATNTGLRSELGSHFGSRDNPALPMAAWTCNNSIGMEMLNTKKPWAMQNGKRDDDAVPTVRETCDWLRPPGAAAPSLLAAGPTGLWACGPLYVPLSCRHLPVYPFDALVLKLCGFTITRIFTDVVTSFSG